MSEIALKINSNKNIFWGKLKKNLVSHTSSFFIWRIWHKRKFVIISYMVSIWNRIYFHSLYDLCGVESVTQIVVISISNFRPICVPMRAQEILSARVQHRYQYICVSISFLFISVSNLHPICVPIHGKEISCAHIHHRYWDIHVYIISLYTYQVTPYHLLYVLILYHSQYSWIWLQWWWFIPM